MIKLKRYMFDINNLINHISKKQKYKYKYYSYVKIWTVLANVNIN